MIKRDKRCAEVSVDDIKAMVNEFGADAAMTFCLLSSWLRKKKADEATAAQEIDVSRELKEAAWFAARYYDIEKGGLPDG